jgi:hypothetical protein
MVLLCQWLCHLCGELWYHTRAEGFTYVSFTHTHTHTLVLESIKKPYNSSTPPPQDNFK